MGSREVSVGGRYTGIARIRTQGIWLECRLPQMLGGLILAGMPSLALRLYAGGVIINPRRAGTRSSVVPGVDISLLAAYTLATLLTFIHCSLYTNCVDTFERRHCWPTLTHKCISKGLLNWYACIVYISVYKLYI